MVHLRMMIVTSLSSIAASRRGIKCRRSSAAPRDAIRSDELKFIPRHSQGGRWTRALLWRTVVLFVVLSPNLAGCAHMFDNPPTVEGWQTLWVEVGFEVPPPAQ